MRRIAAFLEDALHIWRKAGFRASSRFVWSRVFAQSEMLLYELRPTGVEQALPTGWSVTVVRSGHDSAGVDLLRRTGGESEFRNFRREAVAYVLCIGDEPVARSWYFPNSPLARRLGLGAAYFGNMFVRPEWRGQGIQGLLNKYMASLLPVGSRVVMEVVPSNVASQRGLAKVDCLFVGRLHTTVFLGRVVQARIDDSPRADNPSSSSS